MPESRFDADTDARLLDEDRAAVLLDPRWNVDGHILNGGYLQAVTVRVAATVLGAIEDPVAVSTSFAAPAAPGPAVVRVEVLRRGGRVTAVSATLRQDGIAILATLVTFAALPANTAGQPDDPPPGGGRRAEPATAPGAAPSAPAVPGPEECLHVPAEQMPGPPGLASVIDYAFVPNDSRWLAGDFSAGPVIRCWMSFADGRELDPLALTALVDMAPPVSFAQGRFGWAPTLHLQVGMFARPRGRHVLVDLRGEPYDGAFVAEDALLWDGDGTLVARSRQIAVPPRG